MINIYKTENRDKLYNCNQTPSATPTAPVDHFPRRLGSFGFGMLVMAYILIFYSPLASAEEPEKQTLQTVLKTVINNNPEIVAAWENRLALKERIKQSFAGYLPTVNANIDYGNEWTDNPSNRASGLGEVELQPGEIGITVKQMLFDGFKVKNDVKKSKAQFRAADQKYNKASETIILSTVETFLDVLKRRKLLELIKDNVRLHQVTLEKITTKVNAGAGSDADISQTDSRLALASANHASSQASMRRALTRFTRLTNTMPQKLVQPQIPNQLLPLSLEAAQERAVNNHHTVLTASANLDAAKASHKKSLSNYMPSVDLTVNASDSADSSGTESHTSQVYVGISITQNFFNGLKDSSKIKETAKKIIQAENNLDNARRKSLEEAANAWNNLAMSKERIRFLTKHVKISIDTKNAYEEQFELGKRTLLDLLNSENEIYQAKNSLVSEQFERDLNVYRLLFATGELLSAVSVSDSEDPEQTTIPKPANTDLNFEQYKTGNQPATSASEKNTGSEQNQSPDSQPTIENHQSKLVDEQETTVEKPVEVEESDKKFEASEGSIWKVAISSSFLNVRDVQNGKIISKIPDGTVVSVVKTNSDWSFIKFQKVKSGTTEHGWVSSTFLTPEESLRRVELSSSYLNVRDIQNGNIISKTPKGAIVSVVKTNSDWSFIKFRNIKGGVFKYGWVSSKFLTPEL
jgi:outer membrane protein, adhesin transport system